jgi:MFS transporter, ACDE family, multidrug resistance protein
VTAFGTPQKPSGAAARTQEFRRVWVIVVGISLAMMGLTLVAPILPLYAREFGVSRTAAGGLVTAFAVARVIFDGAGGYMTDRLGTRRVMLFGGVLLGASSVLAALAPSYAILVVARFLEGAGSAAFSTAAQSLLVKVTPAARLGRAMALYQVGLLVGVTLGPVVGGFAATIGDLSTPFWIYAGLGFTLVAIVWRGGLPDAPAATHAPARGQVAALFRKPAYVGVVFIGFALFVMRLGARSTLFPLYTGEVLGLGTAMIGLLLASSSLVNLLVVGMAGTATDRFGRTPVAAAGLMTTGVVMIGFGHTTSLMLLLVLSLVFGLGAAFSSVAVPTMAADLAEPGEEGVAIGVYRGVSDMGAIVGPPLLTSIAEGGNFAAGFWVTGILLFVSAAIALGIRETRRPSSAGIDTA